MVSFINIAHADDTAAIEAAQEAAGEFIGRVEVNFLQPLVTLLLGIAFLVFLYGVFEYVRGAANETERAKGRVHITYGIIGMLIMLSAIAILTIATGTFGLTF